MRIVVKVGTSTLAYGTGHLNIRHMQSLCRVLSDLKNSGHEIILVSSGAIGMGRAKLGLKKTKDDMPAKQAAAAVGQCELMYTYDKYFAEYGHIVAQILLTGSDVDHPDRYQNFKNTLSRLLEMQVLPIINENDTVATEEIALGDNDTLAAYVASGALADLLILLTDIDGLYTADPKKDPSARLIENVSKITDEIISLGGGSSTELGTGGMSTKLHAAKICLDNKIDMVIASGEDPEILYDIIDQKPIGTKFSAR